MDEANGRQSSEAPSSESDFYSNNPPADRNTDATALPTSYIANQNSAAPAVRDDDDADDEDSSSEMDLSASSRAPSPELQAPPPHLAAPKRKLSAPSTEPIELADEHGMNKRRRMPSSLTPPPSLDRRSPATLPVELWQQIFLHLSPTMLARCLSVCRAFNSYLTNTTAPSMPKKERRPVRVLDSEYIWASCRAKFFNTLPKPLARCTELQMLQLVGGHACQSCGRNPVPSPCTTIFNCGPGLDGVRVVWPFRIRVCGKCLEHDTLTDLAILQGPAKTLHKGMPYGFLTPDIHFVPASKRQDSGGFPPHLRPSKVYYTGDMMRIIHECDDAMSLGDAAGEEWRKGLPSRGQEEMADCARWERWEASLPPGKSLVQVLREYDRSSFPLHVALRQGRSHEGFANAANFMPTSIMNVSHTMSSSQAPLYNGYGYMPQFPGTPAPVPSFSRPTRDPQEAVAMRQARKAEIERRCQELVPPLMPNVLRHIESFQAAIEIATPVTDEVWNKLEPRILAQREAAELVEHQKQQTLAVLQAALPHPSDMELTKTAKELYDKEYELAQEPLRNKLSEYADECIHDRWNGGHRLGKDTAPTFAVQVILHVYERYLQDKNAGLIPSVDLPTRPGSRSGSPAREPFLSLDNMKWMHDNKIRPLTDSIRRDLFICAGCDEEKKPKLFAFEGLLQHYGAKHTTAFSRGNIVVQWQDSEWPEDPPFHQAPAKLLKPDRKVSDVRTHGRTRNAPPVHREAQYPPPGSSGLLSESPHFSIRGHYGVPAPANGHNQAGPGYGGFYHANQASPRAPPYGQAHFVPRLSEGPNDMSEHAQVNKLSNDAREIWDALEGVTGLLECVRIQAAIHHVVMRFQNRFFQPPSLDLVTDALATNAQIRPVKEAHGLACKICVADQTDGSASYQSYYARIHNVKLYNISSLITHFKVVHQPREGVVHPDWITGMIEMPEPQIISDLISAPGMDDDKLAIIAGAFPHAFPFQLPKIGLIEEPKPDVAPDTGLTNRMLDRLQKKPKQQPKRKSRGGSNGTGTSTPGRGESHEPLPEAKEDEYDPRRPMYFPAAERSPDPARFDTDIARRAFSGPSPLHSGALGLAPTTLAALQNFQNQPRPGEPGPDDRSPSVGRSEPMDITSGPGGNTPKAQPDISAILAQLQTAQVGSSSATMSSRSNSAPKNPPRDPYGQPYSSHGAAPPGEHPRYAARAEYSASMDHSPRYEGHDGYAASTRNADSFQQNSVRSYAAPSYAPAHSPPRYSYVYQETSPHAQPATLPPVYRQQAVQYVQLSPELDRQPPYQYEANPRPPAAAPRQVWIDEYGRQVEYVVPLPIDNAPAPIQYVPHPYEQHMQQQQRAQQQQHHHQQQPQYQQYAPQTSPAASAARPLQPAAVYYGQPPPPGVTSLPPGASTGHHHPPPPPPPPHHHHHHQHQMY